MLRVIAQLGAEAIDLVENVPTGMLQVVPNKTPLLTASECSVSCNARNCVSAINSGFLIASLTSKMPFFSALTYISYSIPAFCS
jgi:hypothetical protein